jgi:hypothetical protein
MDTKAVRELSDLAEEVAAKIDGATASVKPADVDGAPTLVLTVNVDTAPPNQLSKHFRPGDAEISSKIKTATHKLVADPKNAKRTPQQ